MKYELRRNTKTNIICGCVPMIVGIVALAGKEYLAFALMLAVFLGVLINEIRRSKGPVLTFDEKCFQIGGNTYRYEDIEKVDSFRLKYLVWVSITVGGKTVYKFDNSYTNYKEFAKQLTLNSVDHDLFS